LSTESKGGREAAREARPFRLCPTDEAEAEQKKAGQAVWPVWGNNEEGKEGISTRNKTAKKEKKMKELKFVIIVCWSVSYMLQTAHHTPSNTLCTCSKHL